VRDPGNRFGAWAPAGGRCRRRMPIMRPHVEAAPPSQPSHSHRTIDMAAPCWPARAAWQATSMTPSWRARRDWRRQVRAGVGQAPAQQRSSAARAGPAASRRTRLTRGSWHGGRTSRPPLEPRRTRRPAPKTLGSAGPAKCLASSARMMAALRGPSGSSHAAWPVSSAHKGRCLYVPPGPSRAASGARPQVVASAGCVSYPQAPRSLHTRQTTAPAAMAAAWRPPRPAGPPRPSFCGALRPAAAPCPVAGMLPVVAAAG
jgi:hypothetical protein